MFQFEHWTDNNCTPVMETKRPGKTGHCIIIWIQLKGKEPSRDRLLFDWISHLINQRSSRFGWKSNKDWPLNEHVALSSRHEDSRPIPCRCGNGVEQMSDKIGRADVEAEDGRWEQNRQQAQLHVWIHMDGCTEVENGESSSGGGDDDDDASSKFIRRPTTGLMTAHPVHAKPSKLLVISWLLIVAIDRPDDREFNWSTFNLILPIKSSDFKKHSTDLFFLCSIPNKNIF